MLHLQIMHNYTMCYELRHKLMCVCYRSGSPMDVGSEKEDADAEMTVITDIYVFPLTLSESLA